MKILIFISGLCMGSFLCCAAERLLKGKSLLGRSCCDHCHHMLHLIDLIPLLSYLLLHGHCRYCHEKLSLRYPLSELTSAFLYLFLYLRYGLSLQTLEYLFLISLLFVVCCCDLEQLLIPDLCLWLILLCRVFFLLLKKQLNNTLSFLFFGMICVSLPLYLLARLIRKASDKEAMGTGDVLLIAVLGSYLDGFSQLLMLFLSCLAGIFFALFHNGKDRRKAFPFAPCICLSFYLILLFGEKMLAVFFSFSGSN